MSRIAALCFCLAVGVLGGCSKYAPPTPQATPRQPSDSEKSRFAALEINGHRYILYNYYDNCALLHAESCSCHGKDAHGSITDSPEFVVQLRSASDLEKSCISTPVIEGHRYILYNYYDNSALIHDQSCPCQQKK
jgi:hypothetical protein